MSLTELEPRPITDLRGAWTRARTEPNGTRTQNSYQTNRATRAENVRYEMGRVIGRDGFLQGLTTHGAVRAIYQWIAHDDSVGDINRIATFENGSIWLRDQVVVGELEVEAIPAAYSAIFVEAANRLYAALYTASLAAAGQVRVIHPLVTGAPSDKAFMGPMSTVPVPSDFAAGLCTGGTHKLAYIVTSRSGFRGKLSPYAGAIFSPVSITIPADRTIRLTVNPGGVWPTDAAYVQACMASIENPEQMFLVDGTLTAVPSGAGPYTVQMDISIEDERLVLGVDLSDNELALTQMGGAGPIEPFNMVNIGNRAYYFTGTLIYVSDPFDPEAITADHVLQLPAQRFCLTAFKIRGVVYLLGPKWTYATADSNDAPANEWITPYDISSSYGTTCIHGVEANTIGDMAWIANEQGLWDFEGSYKRLPLSYMNSPEWKRINWPVARKLLRIVDDTDAQCVGVFVPLDAATELSHVLVWDYARGRDAMSVDFSIMRLGTGDFSSAALVRDWFTQRTRLWIGSAAAGHFLIQSRDALDDNGVAFEPIYESGSVYRRGGIVPAVDVKVQAVVANVKGFGQLRVRVYDMGRQVYEDLDPFTLEELPTDLYDERFLVESPDCTVEFKTSSAGERFDLSDYTIYGKPWLNAR